MIAFNNTHRQRVGIGALALGVAALTMFGVEIGKLTIDAHRHRATLERDGDHPPHNTVRRIRYYVTRYHHIYRKPAAMWCLGVGLIGLSAYLHNRQLSDWQIIGDAIQQQLVTFRNTTRSHVDDDTWDSIVHDNGRAITRNTPYDTDHQDGLLMYEPYSGRYFRRERGIPDTDERILMLNGSLMTEGMVTLNDYAELLNLPTMEIVGDAYGWLQADGLIVPSYVSRIVNGEPCIDIFVTPAPEAHFAYVDLHNVKINY